MTKNLRKLHLQVWTAFSILMTGAMIIAWVSVPAKPITVVDTKEPTPLPVIAGSLESADYRVLLRTNKDKNIWQLHWLNKSVLKVPTAVLYLADDESGQGGKQVGRIEAKGAYLFHLDEDYSSGNDFTCIIYDFIHERIIDTIKIKL